MYKQLALLLIGVVCLFIIATTTQAQTRGLFVDNGSGTLALARNEKRVALIIGNSNYQYNSQLKNPKNDASDIEAALRNLGFDTQLITDANRQQIINGIKSFRNKATGSSTVALFFYAGHGVQVRGENWIVPTDANPQNESDVTTDCISLSNITDNLNTTGANIIILDACRDNPFTYAAASRSNGTRGLAPPQAPNGTYIAFSTAPGTTAADGTGQRNSPYTSALLNALKQPNLPIENTFKQVRSQLKQRGQTPWESSSLTGDFYFNYKETTTTNNNTADSDSDGIIDTKDQCPHEYGDMANYGCPQRKTTPPPTTTTAEAYTETAAGIALQMRRIQGGSFTMGGNDGDDDEKPTHQVNLDDFYIGKYEVTLQQFRAFINDTGYTTDAEKRTGDYGSYVYENGSWNKKDRINWRHDAEGKVQTNDQHPVIHVSWNDAMAFCKWLSGKTGKNYTLPTEAQWEYAAGNGSRHTKYSWGHGTPTNSRGGNVADETKLPNGSTWNLKFEGYTDGYWATAPIGQFGANDFGLYDMTGNVWEWCSDWYGKDYYANSPTNNPKGPSTGADRVLRGGSWINSAEYCRVADRGNDGPRSRRYINGFRLVFVP